MQRIVEANCVVNTCSNWSQSEAFVKAVFNVFLLGVGLFFEHLFSRHSSFSIEESFPVGSFPPCRLTAAWDVIKRKEGFGEDDVWKEWQNQHMKRKPRREPKQLQFRQAQGSTNTHRHTQKKALFSDWWSGAPSLRQLRKIPITRAPTVSQFSSCQTQGTFSFHCFHPTFSLDFLFPFSWARTGIYLFRFSFLSLPLHPASAVTALSATPPFFFNVVFAVVFCVTLKRQ